jgi:hypothetical protein
MLRALARVSELGGSVFVDSDRRLSVRVVVAEAGALAEALDLALSGRFRYAKEELLRHEQEAVELLERWSQSERPESPSGEQ